MTETLPRGVQAAQPEIDEFNSLLRGELSAVETYQQAIGKFQEQDALSELRRIRDEHTQAASQLRGRILALGGKPATGSGAWGSFVAMVTGAAKVIGPETVLTALHEGEEIGFADYEYCLDYRDVAIESRAIIEERLMPRIKDHIFTLNRLIAEYQQK